MHKVLVQAVVKTLEQIFIKQKYADKAIEFTLKSNPKWGSRDRAFIAENTYDICRWWRYIAALASVNEQRVTLGDIWQMVGTWFWVKHELLLDWPEFKHINPKAIEHLRKTISDSAVVHAFPDWLFDTIKQELPNSWEREIIELNKTAPMVLRVNTIKSTLKEITNILSEKEIAFTLSDKHPEAVVVNQKINLFNWPEFQNGLFEIQDASSQLVAPFLQLQKGSIVIDACAGAGGKTLHIGALMQNSGKIIAMDTEEWKLNNLVKRAKRAGVHNITTCLASTEEVEKYIGKADYLLLDVPCSGLGVLKRNPDAKWKLKVDFLQQIKETQQTIMQEYSKMLKPGGMMVYATCSILPSENQQQVLNFMESNSDYTLIEEKIVSPEQSGFDGFYMARLQRLKIN